MRTPSPLMGLAIGDALGMPFETFPPNRPELAGWDGMSYGSSSYHKLGPGQWTDDSQMSLALGQSLLNRGFFDPPFTASCYVRWFTGSPRGYGKTTALAVRELMDGADWWMSGVDDAKGNGTVMRAAPIGLFHHRGNGKFEAAARDARMDAVITHRSSEAADGSAAVAMAVSHLSGGGTKEYLLDAIIPHMKPGLVCESLKTLQASGSVGLLENEIFPGPAGVPAKAHHTTIAAFFCFLETTNFLDAVSSAIRLGGDTDSVGSVTGGLAGAFYGLEGIPDHLIVGLETASVFEEIDKLLFR